MNILIISHFYELDGVIGSVRWTQLSKRLAKHHNVTVVTNDEHAEFNVKTDQNGITVLSLDNVCDYVKKVSTRRAYSKTSEVKENTIVSNQHTCKKAYKEIIKHSLYMLSMEAKAKQNSKKIVNYFRAQHKSVDLVITTSRPFIDCFIGYEIATEFKCKWILDQRDLPYNDGSSNIEIAFYRNAIKKFNPKVNLYTLVSFGMSQLFVNQLGINESDRNKVVVLHNGYSRDDLPNTKNIKEINEKALSISYIGDLYAGKRDATMLFHAIDKLIKLDNNISLNDIQISYAGGSGKSLFTNAAQYGLQEIIKDNGRLSHDKAMELLYNSDILLLLTWNTDMDIGILPAKMYEYMMMNKPIICITAGNIPNGEAGLMIKNMNIGVSVDYIEYENNLNRLTEYLKLQVNRKKNNESLLFNPDSNEVMRFDYDNLIKELQKLIEGI